MAAVRVMRGQKIWDAEKRGDWSLSLLKAALRALDASTEKLEERIGHPETVFFLIEYRDGLRATGAMIPNAVGPMPPKYGCQLAVACRVRQHDRPLACWLKTPGIPFRHFGELLRGIQHMIHTREPAYPVERTLLTTGILDRVMHSMYPRKGERLASPELAISYQSPRWGFANRE